MKNENTPWLLRYWWLPVAITMMCCLYSAIGDYYTHNYGMDYITEWGPLTQIIAFIAILALIWRVVNLIAAIAYKKWVITVILILFHFVSFALFFVLNLMFYPYSEL